MMYDEYSSWFENKELVDTNTIYVHELVKRVGNTSCKGRFSPSSDEVNRKLANRRKSLSAIQGRI